MLAKKLLSFALIPCAVFLPVTASADCIGGQVYCSGSQYEGPMEELEQYKDEARYYKFASKKHLESYAELVGLNQKLEQELEIEKSRLKALEGVKFPEPQIATEENLEEIMETLGAKGWLGHLGHLVSETIHCANDCIKQVK